MIHPKFPITQTAIRTIFIATLSFFSGDIFSAIPSISAIPSPKEKNTQVDLNTPIPVTVKKDQNGWQFYRDGKPYYVKGAGGTVRMDLAVEVGANSVRTWGIENAKEILDEAHERGLTVMLGMWMQHERHGFDYSNKTKVQKQFEHFKRVIDEFKNHPALLLWGIGNEVDLFYKNTRVWDAIQDIAKYAHQVDPNHPTSTVTAGLDSLEVALILQKAPDIDVYCVNTYGDIDNVPTNIRKFGWTGPYMITEWGPNGHWESPNTEWKAAIEQSSGEKARIYQWRYQKFIQNYSGDCVGSYVFLWGQKQEYTETWYGLFSKEGKQTESIDALQIAWSNSPAKSSTPHIETIFINNTKADQNIVVSSRSAHTASVNSYLLSPSEAYQLFSTQTTSKNSSGNSESSTLNSASGTSETSKSEPNNSDGNPIESSKSSLIKSQANQERFNNQNITIPSALLTSKNVPKKVKYHWKCLQESTDKKAGGDVENEAAEVPISIKNGNSNTISFKAPSKPGAYRLFVTMEYENKVAYANFPFQVAESDKDSKKSAVRMKKYSMESFNSSTK